MRYLQSCGRLWSVCEVVLVPYMDVVVVTVIRVLLFVVHACMLRGCDCDSNAGVGTGAGVVAVSADGSIWVLHVGQVLCLLPTTC